MTVNHLEIMWVLGMVVMIATAWTVILIGSEYLIHWISERRRDRNR